MKRVKCVKALFEEYQMEDKCRNIILILDEISGVIWANFGYLVTSQITGSDTLKELRVLSSAHGIGIIKLDLDNPFESQILIPAKERNIIDWDSCNRLSQENKDFSQYIKLVKQFYQTGEIKVFDWDSRNG